MTAAAALTSARAALLAVISQRIGWTAGDATWDALYVSTALPGRRYTYVGTGAGGPYYVGYVTADGRDGLDVGIYGDALDAVIAAESGTGGVSAGTTTGGGSTSGGGSSSGGGTSGGTSSTDTYLDVYADAY